MTRQIRSPAEIAQVDNDFDTFQLPLDASLNLGAFTAYGVTDNSVDLSMVNVRHLNSTRHFRGMWEATPMDGTVPTPYSEGQVVIGSDRHIYVRTDNTPGTNPDPVGDVAQWQVLSADLDQPVTELRSIPVNPVLNLYHASAQTATFTIRPNSHATSLANFNIDTPVVTGILAGAPTATSVANAPGQDLRITVPPGQVEANTEIAVTVNGSNVITDARGNPVEQPEGQIDSIVTFQDARVTPTVSPSSELRMNSISGRMGTDSASPQLVYTVNLTPDGSSVAEGTAYDSQVTVTLDGSTTPPLQGNTYAVPALASNQNVRFNFPLRPTPMNGQVGTPDPIERPVRVYNPWFWSFGNVIPTDVNDMNEGIILGQSQADDFPFNSGQEFAVTGPTSMIQSLFLAVPTTVNNAIALNTGIAQMQPVQTGNQITVPTAAGGTLTYNLLQYRIGLVSSPTVFRIISTS